MPEIQPIFMANYLIILSVLLIPFCVLSFGVIQRGHHFGLILFGCAISVAFISNKWIKIFVWYVVIWQFIVFVRSVQVFMGGAPENALEGLYSVITITLCALIIDAVSNIKWNRNLIYSSICLAATIQAVIAMSQIIGQDIWHPILKLYIPVHKADWWTLTEYKGIRPGFGSLGLHNALAAFLAISLPFFYRKKWCWLLFLIVPVLLLSKTSTSVGAAIVGVFFYFRKLKYFWIPVLLALGFSVWENLPWSLNIENLDRLGQVFLSGRHLEWWAVWFQITAAFSRFIFGYGPGAIPWTQSFVHCEYLGMFLQYGLIGVLLLIGYIITIPKDNIRLYTSFITLIIVSIGFYPMHHASTAILIILILGLLENEKLYKNPLVRNNACHGNPGVYNSAGINIPNRIAGK